MKLNRLPYGRYLIPMSFIVMLIVSAFLLSSIMNFATAEVNTVGPYFEVSPATTTADDSATFTIDIYVRNAPTSSDWELTLDWDGDVLNATNIGAGELYPAYPVFTPSLPANESMTIGQSMLYGYTFNGDKLLCNVTFLVTADAGSCVINLSDTLLYDSNGVKTECPNNDGFFKETDAAVEDIAVISVSPDVTEVVPGGTVTITVSVKNEGDNTQNAIQVIVYADTETHDPDDPDVVTVGEITINTYMIASLASGATDVDSTTTWVPGPTVEAETYYISAEAIFLTDDDTHDNILIDGPVTIDVDHDLKISSLTVPSEVWSRDVAEIEFTVVNQGNQTETNFDITIKANETLAGTVTIASLAPGASNTSTFDWDTTGWATDATYTINVSAPDLGERPIDLGDNSLTDTILVKPVHDIRIVSIAIPLSSRNVNVSKPATIKVYLANDGTENETFGLYVYADGTEIHYNSSISLAKGDTVWYQFDWDTTGSSKGSYTITGFVPILMGERPEDVADNQHVCGLDIYVDVIDGDINCDGTVNYLDLFLLAKNWMTSVS